MTKQIIILFFLIFAATSSVTCQELNLQVRVSSPNNNKIDPALFSAFENDLTEFFNRNKWTDDEFKEGEKIEGAITITVTNETSSNDFIADVAIQTFRPVYKSSYKTTLINYIDRSIAFSYLPGLLIQKSDVSYFDNMSSIMTFYAYMILGYDYDSFSPFGGDKYFQAARNVIQNLPSSLMTSEGWDNRGGIVGRNRYWMVDNILNPKIRPFRQFFYEYHRLGLDEMYKDMDRQRAVLSSAISGMQDVISDYPNSMTLTMFSDSKRDEIVEIFMPGDRGQKQKVYDIMIQCDPYRADEYSALTK